MNNSVLVKTKYGEFEIPEKGYGLAHIILKKGRHWEEETINFMIKNCANKSIVSAGAYIGDFIIPLAKNTRGNVFTFEPEPVNILFSKKNIDLNRINNVIFSENGLSNKISNGYLKCSGAGFYSNNKNADDINVDYLGEQAYLVDIPRDNTISILLTDLDTFLSDKFITEEISIIQLDIEGHEMEAFEGAKKTIAKNLPILISELPFDGDIYVFLKTMGYVLHERKIGHRFVDGSTYLNHILYIPRIHSLIFDDVMLDTL